MSTEEPSIVSKLANVEKDTEYKITVVDGKKTKEVLATLADKNKLEFAQNAIKYEIKPTLYYTGKRNGYFSVPLVGDVTDIVIAPTVSHDLNAIIKHAEKWVNHHNSKLATINMIFTKHNLIPLDNLEINTINDTTFSLNDFCYLDVKYLTVMFETRRDTFGVVTKVESNPFKIVFKIINGKKYDSDFDERLEINKLDEAYTFTTTERNLRNNIVRTYKIGIVKYLKIDPTKLLVSWQEKGGGAKRSDQENPRNDPTKNPEKPEEDDKQCYFQQNTIVF